MDWHVKEDTPEDIEFIMNILGDVLKFQSSGKLIEAKALLELIEIVLPEYHNSPQYQVVEDLRNIAYDVLYSSKSKKRKI